MRRKCFYGIRLKKRKFNILCDKNNRFPSVLKKEGRKTKLN